MLKRFMPEPQSLWWIPKAGENKVRFLPPVTGRLASPTFQHYIPAKNKLAND